MKLQQLIRGIEGRARMNGIFKMHQELIATSLRNYHAASIQRVFRAWYSRKYRYDHARRKRYIEYVQHQGREVLAMMEEYAAQQREVALLLIQLRDNHSKQRELAEQSERKRQEFLDLAGSLHHLVSTKTIRGVFNPDPKFLEVMYRILYLISFLMQVYT